MSLPFVVVGGCLLDRDWTGKAERTAPDHRVPVVEDLKETARPGGAGLAAALAARSGAKVTLITALARDAAAAELRRLLEDCGVTIIDVGAAGRTVEKIRVAAGDLPLLRLDRGGVIPERARGEALALSREAMCAADVVLVSDYGLGLPSSEAIRRALSEIVNVKPVVWDPHPRGGPPVPGVLLATPNRDEAALFAGGHTAGTVPEAATLAEKLRDAWKASSIAVTLGSRGALVAGPQGPVSVFGATPVAGDSCGAGDRFAVEAALRLAGGAAAPTAVEAAVHAAAAFVAAGGAGAVFRPGTQDDGVVVATGGCFDLLHTGHIATLRAARRLGGRLVVLLNSDDSVRRLKGPARPLVPEADRRTVLMALDCVDDVVTFDEDTPERALRALRPDIFVKGGDYASMRIPEEAVMAEWGAKVVVVPYLKGRSTTDLAGKLADAER